MSVDDRSLGLPGAALSMFLLHAGTKPNINIANPFFAEAFRHPCFFKRNYFRDTRPYKPPRYWLLCIFSGGILELVICTAIRKQNRKVCFAYLAVQGGDDLHS